MVERLLCLALGVAFPLSSVGYLLLNY